MLLLTLCLLAGYTSHPQVLCLVPVFIGMLWWVEHAARTRTSVLGIALAFGAVIAIGYRWLYQTTQDFGGLSPASALGALILFAVVGVVHLVLFALIHRATVRSRMVRGAPRPHPLCTIALFVCCEALPIRLFAWQAGHAAVDCVPLAQAAAWGGVSAVTFVSLCLVVPLYEWMLAIGRSTGERRPGMSPPRPGAALATFLLGLLAYAYGIYDARTVRAQEQAATHHVHVGIVQANVGSFNKRQSEQQKAAARLRAHAAYKRVTDVAAAADVDLIVWPETAIAEPIPYSISKTTPRIVTSMLSRARTGYGYLIQHGAKHGLLVGSYEQVPRSRSAGPVIGKPPDRRYNCAALRPRGVTDPPWTVYRKHHLIPFGESMPLGLPKSLMPQGFDMRAGASNQPPLEFEGKTLIPLLCYEGLLEHYVRNLCDSKRPDLLVSLANDSWFGDTWEPHQHLSFTRFRSIEHRAPMIRSTNTGISAFVSATGEVEARLGVGQEGALVRSVPLVDRPPTLYLRFGHIVPWLFAAMWFLGMCRLLPGDRS